MKQVNDFFGNILINFQKDEQKELTETKFQNIACLTFMPELSKTAKSPISWGNSWKKTAKTVPSPIVYDPTNAAPIA